MLNDQRVCTFNTWNSLPYMVIYKISIRPYKLCTCRCTMRDKYMVTQKKKEKTVFTILLGFYLPTFLFILTVIQGYNGIHCVHYYSMLLYE